MEARKTIEELKNECVKIFGLEHKNTQSFFQDCTYCSNAEYLNGILEEMKMYQKINECAIAHAIVELNTGEIITVKLVNQCFDFYASAWSAIDKVVRDKYFGIQYISVLDIITD